MEEERFEEGPVFPLSVLNNVTERHTPYTLQKAPVHTPPIGILTPLLIAIRSRLGAL